MSARRRWVRLLSLMTLSAFVPLAHAQQPLASPAPANPFQQPLSALPTQTQNVLNFYGAGGAGLTLSQIPRSSAPIVRPRARPRPVSQQPQARPFAGAIAAMPPTVSPYLNLYRNEDEESAPNYYAFVKPQLQQNQVNRAQQSEIRRLQSQLRKLSMEGSRAAAATTGTPATGHGTRFMNLGGYFPPR